MRSITRSSALIVVIGLSVMGADAAVAGTSAAIVAPASSPSTSYPPAPRGVTVTAGRGEATVRWKPPVAAGGTSRNLVYEVFMGREDWNPVDGAEGHCFDLTQLSCRVAGLKPGKVYSFTVVAYLRSNDPWQPLSEWRGPRVRVVSGPIKPFHRTTTVVWMCSGVNPSNADDPTFEVKARPEAIALECPSDDAYAGSKNPTKQFLRDLTWSTWGRDSATGNGIFVSQYWSDADRRYVTTPYPAEVKLSSVKQYPGWNTWSFTEVSVTYVNDPSQGEPTTVTFRPPFNAYDDMA